MSTAGFYGVLAEFNPLLPTQSVPLWTGSIGPWPMAFSNHMLMVAVAVVLLCALLARAVRPAGMIPGGWSNAVEAICVFLREEVARPAMHEHTDRFIGFLWTVFFFVLSLNLLAMIPSEQFITLLTGRENHWGGSPTANIWVTGAMALVTFILTHAAGIRHHGLGRYLAQFAPPAPWWIRPLLFILEMITAFIRPLTLAIRLFANIVAGHILLATLFGLIVVFKSLSVAAASVLGAVALSLMELLVAFIQAFIFTFLSAIYIGFSVSSEH